jgi:hypothetical protein
MPVRARDPDPRGAAEALAIAALGFLGREPERLSGFLALTGIGPTTLRAAAADPGFLTSVLDHVCADEKLLLAFAEADGIDPEAVVRAREALARGAQPAARRRAD